jgi:hypothetical protein
MCWSATADLVGGGVIAAVGAAGVAVTLCKGRPRDLPLAALPLLLGAHQVVESVVWRSGGGTGPAVTAWAVIALPLLAVWVPAGVLLTATPRAPSCSMPWMRCWSRSHRTICRTPQSGSACAKLPD